ncbi:MAG: flagellin [Verrucomicrobiales bacterium]|nr:flagellin [Verrucomicrobiales bacterium]
MVINTNITANSAARNLADSTRLLSKSLARLSSGTKITSPEDDAAGLSQVMRLEAQINRNSAVRANVGNAVSFVQTQDGFLQKVQGALDRMSELSVLSQDVTKSNTDRSNYSVEFTQLQNYISDIGTKDFNGVTLFATAGQQVTIDSDASKFSMNALDMTSSTVTTGLANIYNGTSSAITTTTSAASALSNIQTAIQSLADMRAKVGANIQRLNMTDDQVTILNENMSAANSRIKDVDVADEATEFARYNILVQSGTAMLGQANMLPSMALQLIG